MDLVLSNMPRSDLASKLLVAHAIFLEKRNEDGSLAVRCRYSGKSFMFSIHQRINYAYLFEYICERFRLFATDIIELHYSLPGCPLSFLGNDNDFQMLFIGAKIYNLDCVEIIVEKNSEGCSKGTSVSCEDSCSEVLDEDDYLTEGYRSKVSKHYLSREWGSYIQCEGQKFHGGVSEFRDKLPKYAIEVGFTFVYTRNDWYRIHAVCSNMGTENCEWHVAGYSNSVDGCFYIDSLNNLHTCKCVLRQKKHVRLGSKVVKSYIQEDISYNMSLKLRDIQIKMQSAYGFEISYKVAWKAKQSARDMIYGSEAESFNMLSWFREAVLASNPGSVFVFEVHPDTNQFHRLFFAYACCIEGFKFCLPVVYVDGTFGKSLYKGTIFCATGRTGNKDDFLKDMPLENWCRAFFPGSCYGIMANSMAESFNAWSEEHEMPAYGMFD
uniref:uncharacterized protein LOC105352745 n=1 Tax=Fragaria vesca subsp. vesca TaxID=101020 RepID=UPI0005C9F354|nr:PREDICTED: uncharacterized protein LOC105352745 [Fragaria vesca subsp. vesca]